MATWLVCEVWGLEDLKAVLLFHQHTIHIKEVVEKGVGFLLRESFLIDVLLIPDFNAHDFLVLSHDQNLGHLLVLSEGILL